MCGACIVFFILLHSVLYFLVLNYVFVGLWLCVCIVFFYIIILQYIFVVQVAIIYYILHARETEFKIHWLL